MDIQLQRKCLPCEWLRENVGSTGAIMNPHSLICADLHSVSHLLYYTMIIAASFNNKLFLNIVQLSGYDI